MNSKLLLLANSCGIRGIKHLTTTVTSFRLSIIFLHHRHCFFRYNPTAFEATGTIRSCPSAFVFLPRLACNTGSRIKWKGKCFDKLPGCFSRSPGHDRPEDEDSPRTTLTGGARFCHTCAPVTCRTLKRDDKRRDDVARLVFFPPPGVYTL